MNKLVIADKLEGITDTDLMAELERRRLVQKEQDRIARITKNSLIVKHRDVLISLLTHDRNSCETLNNAGYHRYHGVAYCSLCALKELQTWDDDIDVTLSLTLTKRSSE